MYKEKTPVRRYKIHKLGKIFPLMNDDEFNGLVEDIKKNGLVNPIWLHQGKIIDGKERYRACLKAGVRPRFRNWNGKGSLVDFVISMNAIRQHFSLDQRACMAVKYMELFGKEKQAGKNHV